MADVTENALQSPDNPITPERLRLNVDPTRTNPNGLPVYNVEILGEDGILYVINDTRGRPMAWVPNWQKSQTYLEEKGEYQELIDSLREERMRRSYQLEGSVSP